MKTDKYIVIVETCDRGGNLTQVPFSEGGCKVVLYDTVEQATNAVVTFCEWDNDVIELFSNVTNSFVNDDCSIDFLITPCDISCSEHVKMQVPSVCFYAQQHAAKILNYVFEVEITGYLDCD